MILGDTCTRNCRFCAVKKGKPLRLNLDEPNNLAKAVKMMRLNYAVITSVTRDDLQDGGASQFVCCVERLRESNENIKIELLTPDFKGIRKSLEIVIRSRPEIIGHNLETVSRLYKKVRPKANYKLSLEALRQVKESEPAILTKSGIMVGLGESFEEVAAVMEDLRGVDCDILTIGQYLSPSREHLAVERFVTQKEFDRFKEIGLALGFRCVVSAPLVRSSYKAYEVFEECLTQ